MQVVAAVEGGGKCRGMRGVGQNGFEIDDGVEAARKCKVGWGSLVHIVLPKSKAAGLFPFGLALPVVLR